MATISTENRFNQLDMIYTLVGSGAGGLELKDAINCLVEAPDLLGLFRQYVKSGETQRQGAIFHEFKCGIETAVQSEGSKGSKARYYIQKAPGFLGEFIHWQKQRGINGPKEDGVQEKGKQLEQPIEMRRIAEVNRIREIEAESKRKLRHMPIKDFEKEYPVKFETSLSDYDHFWNSEPEVFQEPKKPVNLWAKDYKPVIKQYAGTVAVGKFDKPVEVNVKPGTRPRRSKGCPLVYNRITTDWYLMSGMVGGLRHP